MNDMEPVTVTPISPSTATITDEFCVVLAVAADISAELGAALAFEAEPVLEPAWSITMTAPKPTANTASDTTVSVTVRLLPLDIDSTSPARQRGWFDTATKGIISPSARELGTFGLEISAYPVRPGSRWD